MTDLAGLLEREWGLSGVRVTVHNGGMNSLTWWVDRGGRRWVAKSVRATEHASLLGGLQIAARVAAAGVPAGAPVLTRRGELTAWIGDRPIALLEYVPGEGLSSRETDHPRIGATLGRVHAALTDPTGVTATVFDWLDPAADHLDVRAWIRPAVTAAMRAVGELGAPSLTHGALHLDPAPDAFRYDPATGRVGLIDWASAQTGPFLYDLASAVMYVGGPDRAGSLLAAYLATGPLDRAEVDRGLATMLRYRWAVQAYYFAYRIAHRDLTGIADHDENEKGLADARTALRVYER
jgi:Ser/Thr protein kinase RdoA (MazF antagonist)